ncbi:MAG: DUF2341 domain-containing protein [Deltaproteobacteria bacterium]|nr:DUF2341 domain-containing protein [Deltaproteobacteria bacterium]
MLSPGQRALIVALAFLAACTLDAPGPDRPPVAVAGPDRSLQAGEEIEIDGSSSFDPDGDPISAYTWALLSGPPGSDYELAVCNQARIPFSAEAPGAWLLSLVVEAHGLASEPAVVRVTVRRACSTDDDCENDGLWCNGFQRCVEGSCVPFEHDCDDGDPCTEDHCIEEQDGYRCDNPPIADPPSEGPLGDVSCNDGIDNDCDGATDDEDTGCQPCTQPSDCDDDNPCTLDDCVDEQCVNDPVTNETSCDDGLYCTQNDMCQSGICRGDPVDCSPLDDDCHQGVCEEAQLGCVAQPTPDEPCDDGDYCTAPDACDEAGECKGGAGTPCTTPCLTICNSQTGTCEPDPQGSPCDDGAACSIDDQCDGTGLCAAGTLSDAACPGGEVCLPLCFDDPSGCGTPPASLDLSCESPLNLETDTSARCSIDLDGMAGQASCLGCRSRFHGIVLAQTDFEDDTRPGQCSLDGWRLVGGRRCYDWDGCDLHNPDQRNCCENFPCPPSVASALASDPAFEASRDSCGDHEWRLERSFDTTGLEDVRLCFDYASHGAMGSNEILQVEIQSDLSNPSVLVCDYDGPKAGQSDTWYRWCYDLMDEADDKPFVTVRFFLNPSSSGQAVLIDNIELTAALRACPAESSEILHETFQDCPANPGSGNTWNDWQLSSFLTCSTGFSCPNSSRRILARTNQDGFLERSVDSSGFEQLELCFYSGESSAQEPMDLISLEVDPDGSGWQEIWSSVGDSGTDSTCARTCLELSRRLPELDDNPDWKLRYRLRADASGEVDLDEVVLSGRRICENETLLALSEVSEIGGGSYALDASPSRVMSAEAELACEWGAAGRSGPGDQAGLRIGSWWNELWSHRVRLRFDNRDLEQLADVPVLVRLDSSRIDYFFTADGGADLRFIDPGELDPVLAYEIEDWVPFGTSTIWVRVPQIDADSIEDSIWLYYGNATVAQSGERPEEVWDDSFAAVWHLNHNASDSSGDTHGYFIGTENADTLFAGGLKFLGGDYVDFGDHDNLEGLADLTVEAWVLCENIQQQHRPYVGQGNHAWGLKQLNTRAFQFYVYDTAHRSAAWGTVESGYWYYVVGRYDASTESVHLFVDGQQRASASAEGIPDVSDEVQIGHNSEETDRYFIGQMDEVRISRTARPDDWIEAQHRSGTDSYVIYCQTEIWGP